MGYALLFARMLSQNSQTNEANLRMMQLQNQKSNITRQISNYSKQAAYFKSMIPQQKEGQNIPTLEFQQAVIQTYTNMIDRQIENLTAQDQMIDQQIQTYQTQAQASQAESAGLKKSIGEAIGNSSPQYGA